MPAGRVNWLLRWIEARTPVSLRDYVVGDLEEEFNARRAGGTIGAWRWLVGQAIRFEAGELRSAAARLDGRWGRGRPARMHRGGGGVEMIWRDVKYALRRLARSPVFTVVAILSLALGTGANTAIFTLFKSVFLADAGIDRPERVVQVYRNLDDARTGNSSRHWSINYRDYRRMVEESDGAFSHATAYRPMQGRTEPTGDAVVTSLWVSGDYFGTLGADFLQGRGFEPGTETDVEDGPNVVVLDHAYWVDAMGAAPDALGSTIRVNGEPHTVIGILAPEFLGVSTGIHFEIYLPDRAAVASPASDNLVGAARLSEGVTVPRVEQAMATIASRVNETRPADLSRRAYTIVPQDGVSIHPEFDGYARAFSLILFGVVGTVLLITCTNLASFQLARTADRRREFAVRRAIGADTGQMLRQLLIESTLLGVAGSALGVWLALAGLRALLSIRLPLDIVRVDLTPDALILAFSLFVGIVAGLLFGLLPALTASRVPVAATLRGESGKATGGGSQNIRGALVVGQVALSLALLIAAGLFSRSLLVALDVDPGFDRYGVASITVAAASSGYEAGEPTRQLLENIQRDVEALPGVQQVALASRVPLELGIWRTHVRRPDVEYPEGVDGIYPEFAVVTPGYFELMGMRMIDGSDFTGLPIADSAEMELVIDSVFAREIWPELRSPLGQVVEMNGYGRTARVVGVVATHKNHTLGEQPEGYAYVPLVASTQQTMRVLARGAGGVGLAARMREVAKASDPDLYVHTVETLEDATDTVYFLPRLAAVLLSLFGALALFIASLGLWGLVRYSIARREKEIGIRLSLGAKPAAVVRSMTVSGTRLALIGSGVGVALGIAAGLGLEPYLFGVRAFDPITLIALPSFLMAVAALAAWIPARRAAKVDPMVALRAE
jgi:predicted permease